MSGELYTGVKIYVDGSMLTGLYPPQPTLAEGSHTVRDTWISGPRAGKELTQSFESKADHHFFIRADPDNDHVVVQQVR